MLKYNSSFSTNRKIHCETKKYFAVQLLLDYYLQLPFVTKNKCLLFYT